MEELLEQLRKFDALRDVPIKEDGRCDQVVTRLVRGQPPSFAPAECLERFPAPVRRALAALGIDRLYEHQAEAVERIWAGEDVVIEAPTASGKTLCFNIPLALNLLTDPQARALMVHPMKALSNDQRRQFDALARELEGTAGRRLESWIFDGDLPQEYRKLLKERPPAVLFTNPEILHQSFLGWHQQWLKFLRNLKLVILDEIHEYRGYFGTNVALLLRRFFAKLAQLGVRPQVVLATATCGNAAEHAYRLTGRRCRLVRATATMRPERHFAFISPAIPDFRFHDVYRLRVVRAALACHAMGLSTVIFCPSRRFAEEAAISARREARQYGIDPNAIAPYRSGYEAELRRDIEEGLRDGRYRTVFSTNALEIGVDIGRLDVCILAGFPDSILSAWQRIGRVGRSFDKKAYVLFYAMNNPFDQFIASNIDAFLNKPLDEILVSVDNEELMARHVPYLVHECGGELNPELAEFIGKDFLECVRRTMEGRKPARGRGPYYQRLSIRGKSGGTWRLVYKGKDVGEITDVHLFREAYVGAIYNHFGKRYRVTAHGANEVYLEDAEPHLRTEGVFYTTTTVSEILSGFRYAETVAAYYGRLTVYENFSGYRVVDTRSGEVVDEVKSTLARPSNVRGFWLELEDASRLSGGVKVEDLVGVEQLMRIGAPFVVPCDRHDLGTWTTLRNQPAVFLYETVPGGIGVAEKALEIWPTVLETGIRIAENCGCKHGCPSCLVPQRSPSGGNVPHMARAVAAGRWLMKLKSQTPRERFDPEMHAWEPLYAESI